MSDDILLQFTNPIETKQVPFEYRGKTLTADVSIFLHDDDTDPSDGFDFGNVKENAEYLARFKSGELVMACIEVHTTVAGIEGADYLGACHIRTAHADEDVLETVESNGMVAQALAELKDELDLIAHIFETK